MIIGDKDDGTVTKGTSRESVNNRDNTTRIDATPILNRSNSSLICQAKTCKVLAFLSRLYNMLLTLKSAETVHVAILDGCGFVDPAGIPKNSSTLAMACV